MYDPWLLSNNSRRKWFPYKLSTKIYPNWEEKKNPFFKEENRVEFSLEDQSSGLPVQNFENKHIMLDTSEQDLSSSYRDAQGSDTEEESSTNGSASEQNLFISISE